MNTHRKSMKCWAFFVAAIMLMSSVMVSAETMYLPDVTAAMSKASYWIKKDKNPDEVLATPEEIDQINQDIIAAEKAREDDPNTGTGVWDMTTWTNDTYDVGKRNDELVRAANYDAEYCYDGLGAMYKYNEATQEYDEYGTYQEAYQNLYKEMIDNCVDQNTESSMPTGYAICTKRTELRNFPSPTPLPDSPSDPDFDVQYLTAVSVGEPMIIRGKSGDGKYYHARTSYLSGWVSASDIAFCKNRDEWLSAWNFDDDQALIVYDDKITTEDSNYAPETANRKLTMGVKLRIADRADWVGKINNRYAYNNYVVWMPVRKEDGSFENKLALISEHCKVSEGYLPITTRNLAEVMFNQLGNAYGWGGMLGSQDCSGYVRDVYRCFGLELGRNTTNQAVQPVRKFKFKDGMKSEEKAEIIKQLPLGSELLFSGHAMIYLGNEGDKLYVISSVSNLMVDDIKTRVRGAVVNTLDIKRANKKTWLESLHTAEIPYYSLKAKDISGATMEGLEDTTYTGDPITPEPEVILDGVTLREDIDYSLSYDNNTQIGTASVTAVGKGKYEGNVSGSFQITAPDNPTPDNPTPDNPTPVNPTSDINDATVETIENQVYTGNPRTPKPVLTINGVQLQENTDYTLTYSGNVNVGKATVTITGTGGYNGSKNISFNIIPKGTTISKLTRGNGSIKVTWKKQAAKMSTARITGYQIQYATNKNFTKNMKKVKVTKYKTTSKKIQGLKRKKKYYLRIRTYKESGDSTYFSKWSKAKTIKTK